MKSTSTYYLFIMSLIILSIFKIGDSVAQVSTSTISLLGNHGLILTPSARKGNDRELNINIGYFPEKYRILTQKPIPFNEWHTNMTIMFLPFLEVSATVMTPDNLDEQGWGIGDRSYKAKLQLFKEKKYVPAIAIGIHDPFATNTNQGAVYLVGTKNYSLANDFSIDANLGYGFDIQNNFWLKTGLFQDEAVNNVSHLKGWFGGLQCIYRSNYSIMIDYDTEKFNMAASAIFFKYISAQVYLLGFNAISFGVSARWLFGDKLIR
ncbi:MAG: YjbH domain-containing protein [Bacteroidales bacterium]|nr:YjbH domain-containing protein [Bacteroidales bacterium]MCF8458482.1 YjbH domain-containing protein [Bacteroidales bacterium]